MNLIHQIILGIIKLALVLALAGSLIDVTLAMRNEAIKAHQQGLISLKKLNQSLNQK